MEEGDDKDQFDECMSEGDDKTQEKSQPPPPPPPPKRSTTTKSQQQAQLDSFFQTPSETTAPRVRVGRDGGGDNSETPRPASKPKAPAANPKKRTASAPAPARVETSQPI